MQKSYGKEYVKALKLNLIEIAKVKGYVYDKEQAEFVKTRHTGV